MRRLLLGLVVAAQVGCGGAESPVDVVDDVVVVGSVTIAPEFTQVVAGDSLTLVATVNTTNGSTILNPTVSWSSSNEAVLLVSNVGVVAAEAPGTAVITATVDQVSGQSTITVTPKPLIFTSGRLAAGLSHTCALSSGGQAFCWGDNAEGQLGDGSTDDR